MADQKKNNQEESLSVPSTIIQPKVDPNPGEVGTDSLISSNTKEDELSGHPLEQTPTSDRRHFFHKLLGGNAYLIVFGMLILVAVAVIGAGYEISRNNNPKPNKATSLSDQQLTALKGNTTLVGDSKQVLDVQSNSIFEGTVLVRKDLDVAGSIKIGGPLSLSGVSVGGTSSFNQVQINNTLSVAGNSTLQGQVTIQKSLSVAGGLSVSGTLSAGTLSVSKFQLTGDLGLNRHITSSGGVPSRVAGTAVGSGGTVSVNGSDTAGTVTINTGSGPPAGNLVTVNFAAAYSSTPHVVITPIGSAAAGLGYYVSRNSSSFTIATTSPPPAGSSFSFDYIVVN
jgi:cytoskeletal protein CcmA (bactofilin family)